MVRLDEQLQTTRSQLADGKAEIERLSRLLQENGHTVPAAAALQNKSNPAGRRTTETTKTGETGQDLTAGSPQEGVASAPAATAPASKRPAPSGAGGTKSKRRRGSALQYVRAGAGSAKDSGDSAAAAAAARAEEEEEEKLRASGSLIHPIFARVQAKRVTAATVARVVDTAREAGEAADKIIACEKRIATAAAAAAAAAAGAAAVATAGAAKTRDASGDGDNSGGEGVDAEERGLEAGDGRAEAAVAEENAAREELETLMEARTGAIRTLTKTPLESLLAAMEVRRRNQGYGIMYYAPASIPSR